MKKLLLFSALGMSIAVSAAALHFNHKYQPFKPDMSDDNEMECTQCLFVGEDTYCATASSCMRALYIAHRMHAND